MNDPMDDDETRRRLAASPPPAPGAHARERALASALAAFDATAAAAPQGIRAGGRPSRSRPHGLAQLGRLLMTYMPSTRALALGTGSLAAMAVAVLATTELMRRDGALRLPEPAIVLTPSGGLGNPEPVPTAGPVDPGAALGLPPSAGERPAAPSAPSLDPAVPEPALDAPPPAGEEAAAMNAPSVEAVIAPQGMPTVPKRSTRATCIGTAADCDPATPPAPLPLPGVSRLAPPTAGGADAPAVALGAPSAEGTGVPVAQDRTAFSLGPGMTLGPAVGFRGNDAVPSSVAGRTGAAPQLAAEPAPPVVGQEQGRDRFADIETNNVKVTAEEPVSTFSIDVDTASYSFVRRALMQGVLPPKDAVRVEELVNYFPYDYPAPDSRETPFATHVAVTPTPWNAGTRLVRIGIQGYDIAPAERPRANLVFLVDTSGSMDAPDRLPLLVNSLRLLLESLEPDDRVAIVAYAGSAGTVLEPTPASEKAQILSALDNLWAGGSTAGGEGIRQAYRLAEAGFDPQGVNRVILATDGDFNVGITSTDELQGFVERQRDSGVYLSVLGFGRGNFNDELMQALAQNGNGQAAYIDTLSEARKTLVEEASSTLFPIAQDVKIQVEFNPATVAEHRLIGYETRLLAREDFNNDRIDAGEIGAGHSVTALYEITPAGSEARQVDALRYGGAANAPAPVTTESAGGAAEPGDPAADEYAFLKIRYKLPGESESRLITRPIAPADERSPDAEARFAAAVAAFGQLLRGGEHLGGFGYDDVVRLANGARGEDPWGYRAEFVTLARLAASAAALEPQRR